MEVSQIILTKYGDTPKDAIENCLELQTSLVPGASSLGPDEILVGVKSAAVSFVDFIMMTSQYQHISNPPYVPGLEFAGEVLAVGGGVTKVKPGDCVFSDYQKVGPRSKGEYQGTGGWCTHTVVPEEGIHIMPVGWSFAEATSFLANFETAYFALRKRANIQPGETVLITGASGASGMAMVQLAREFGARVIVTGRSESKLEKLKELGVDAAINSSELSGRALRDAVQQVNGGNDVEAVIDTVGGHHGLDAFRCVAFEGRFVIVGWASNISASGGRQNFVPDALPTNIMQMKCLKVVGSPMVIYSMQNPEWRREQVGALMDLANNNRIRPVIGQEFELHDFRQAAQTKYESAVLGSCVLNMPT